MTEASSSSRPVAGGPPGAAVLAPDPSPLPALTGGGRLTPRQELVLSNLVRVMAVIGQHIAKQEEDRTTDFL